MDSQSSNNVRDIRISYRKPESIVRIRNNSPNALHVAATLGLPSFVREIVDHSPQLALDFDEHGLTPCHLAVANCHISVVKELLNSKVGIDIFFLRDKGGFLPIHSAVMKGNVDVLKVVNDTCYMWMLQELTWQGDNILHLTLKFDSLEAFCYLWHFLSVDKKLINSGDGEGNTLLHLAVMRRQQEIVKMLVGKVDLNAVNLNGSTALNIFFDLAHKHGDITLEEMIRRASGRMIARCEASEVSRTQSSSPETGTGILFYLWRMLFDFKRLLSRQVPNNQGREASNTLMIVATLIATITFQSALNPPGGFIQTGKDSGMAVLERYLDIYLLFDMMAFISSFSVILLTIYVVPKWKGLIKLTIFIIWISIFFTFMSFHNAIAVIFGHVIDHPLIFASLCIGDGIVSIFAFLMFIYSWYLLHRRMSTFLKARSIKGIIGRSKINYILSCFSWSSSSMASNCHI